ncbi:MFS general substrate transporter [Laetiporus sulphureus 93-53]|uniref:MFS general substrate transporter n=1 Tax=Laetiporus sulphureus 93-53 TaxID=1314785 RepID=A0A165CMI3_9APHY|nr:MFS general substrate transporter [Laetiporus sulphureus 93-53]KZT03080.1 MFS general substrate transporter [Laetiporus sulphureus 93-53]
MPDPLSSAYKDDSLSPVASLAKDGELEKAVEVDTFADGNVGLNEFEAAKNAGVRVTAAENKRIAMKIDIWILPMLCISQALSIVDKTALNYGNLYGMKTDLGVTGQQFDWFASAFYFGYLIGNYPQGWLLQHYHSGRVLATMTAIWGVIVICIASAKSFGGVLAAYFFLGIIESIVTPGLTLLTAIWYAQPEVPLRTMIWYSFNGFAGIFGGFLAYGVGHIRHPSLARWKYIFLILGAISLAYSFILWFMMPDSPVGARFLTKDEKLKAVKRVAEAKNGMKNIEFKTYQIKQAIRDPKTWLLFIAAIAAQIPNGIVSNFSTIVIKGMGFTTLQTTLLDVASSGVQIASLLVAGLITTYIKNSRVVTMAAGNITCIIAAACLTYLPSDQKWNRLVAYWFTSFQSVGFSLSLVMISNNIGGYTKRTFTTALTFVGYCIGNIIGPHFLISSEAPTYHTGTRAMFIGYVIKTASLILLGLYMWYRNVKKDREYGKVSTYEDELKGEEAGMHDLTEFENPYHRYVL